MILGIPSLRTFGVLASALLCVHSASYLFSSSYSVWRLLHNFADLSLFGAFGFAGIVAEVFPRESLLHRALKANLPFLGTLVGRSLFYMMFGMIAMGNYNVGRCKMTVDLSGDSQSDEPTNSWGFFCVGSGVYMFVVGVIMLVYALRYRNPQNRPDLTQPIALASSQGEDLPTTRQNQFAPFPTSV